MRNRSYSHLAGVIDKLVDPSIGIIKFLREELRPAGAPAFFHFYAQVSNTSAFTRQENFSRAGGASTNRDRAIAKSIGESIERYCSAIYEVDEMPLLSCRNAPFECIRPREFALYDEPQYLEPGFQFVRFTEDSAIRWTRGVDLLDGREVNVPAAMVYVPYYYYSDSSDQPIVQPISTGLACHTSYEEAALNGICEVIERDAFMLTWQAMITPQRIRKGSLDKMNASRMDLIEGSGYIVDLFDITQDSGIPVVLSTARCRDKAGPALCVAAAASLSANVAVTKCLEELEHTRSYSYLIWQQVERLPLVSGYSNVETQEDHINFWCDRRNLHFADFLFESTAETDLSQVGRKSADNLGDLAAVLGNGGYRTVIVDLSTDDISGLGFYVVRALIPGYHPFFVGHKYRALGGSRMKRALEEKGKGENPAPHPFP